MYVQSDLNYSKLMNWVHSSVSKPCGGQMTKMNECSASNNEIINQDV